MDAPWRTIATYRNKGKALVIDGETYLWSKHPNFDQVADLPAHTGEPLEAAIASLDDGVRERFVSHGWRLIDPYTVSKSADSYRRFVLGAKGEFSVEKDCYVRLNTGWFSDRIGDKSRPTRSEEHTSELQSRPHLVCRLLLEKKK